eukprot:snap_masked-scaffold_23-processed-gene-4.14-mRNA-1 protein AED:1.00 eAED:1.00 QI:0/0/0/0/1/1/3/0/964
MGYEDAVKLFEDLPVQKFLVSLELSEKDIVFRDENHFTDFLNLILLKCPSLVRLNLYFNTDYFPEEYYDRAKNLLTDKANLTFCVMNDNLEPFKDIEKKKLGDFFTLLLQASYETKLVLKESVIVVLGDGRSGKTSTIKSLLDEDFNIKNPSTVLIDMSKLFGVVPTEENWKTYSDPELYAQRLQRSRPKDFSFALKNKFIEQKEKETNKKKKIEYDLLLKELREPRKFNFSFQDKLRKETLKEKKFLESLRIESKEYQTSDHFFRFFDFGGQEVFKSLHPLFLNDNGNFMIVFDMRTFYEQKLKNVMDWFNSILLYAPNAPVVLVGTHYDQFLKKELENPERPKFTPYKVLQRAEKYVNKYIHLFKSTLGFVKNGDFTIYNVDNSKGGKTTEVLNIKRAILKLATGASEVERRKITEKITVGAIFFMDFMKSEYTHISMQEFKKEAEVSGFTDEETRGMLKTYVKLGLALHFKGTTLEEKEDIISLQPAWLVKALGSFIHDKELHHLGKNITPDLARQKKLYFESGRLTGELFEHFTGNVGCDAVDRKFILEISKKALIMVDYIYSYVDEHEERDLKKQGKNNSKDKGERNEYLVTALLPKEVFDEEGNERKAEAKADMFFEFEHEVPTNFVPQLIALLLQRAKDDMKDNTRSFNFRPFLGKNYAQITFDADFGIEMHVYEETSIRFLAYGNVSAPQLRRLEETVLYAREAIKNHEFNKHLSEVTDDNPRLILFSEDNKNCVEVKHFRDQWPKGEMVIDYYEKLGVDKHIFDRFDPRDVNGALHRAPKVFISYFKSDKTDEVVKRIEAKLDKLEASHEEFPLGLSEKKFSECIDLTSRVEVVVLILDKAYVGALDNSDVDSSNKKGKLSAAREFSKIYGIAIQKKQFIITFDEELQDWKNWGKKIPLLFKPYQFKPDLNDQRLFNFEKNGEKENFYHFLDTMKKDIMKDEIDDRHTAKVLKKV